MNIEIEKGLVLNNPTVKIKSVQYDQFENLVNVECYFTEENSRFIHSRNYTFTNETGRDLVYSDVIELLKTNEVLNQLI